MDELTLLRVIGPVHALVNIILLNIVVGVISSVTSWQTYECAAHHKGTGLTSEIS